MDDKLTVLLHEHEVINKKIDSFIDRQFFYMTSLFTLSAGFIYFALNNGNNSVMAELTNYLPYLFIIIGPIFLYKFNRAVLLQGYRTCIEDKINEEVEGNLILGGSLVKEELLQKNLFAKINYIVMSIFFIATTIICNWINPEALSEGNVVFLTYPKFHFYIQFVFILAGIIIFILKNISAFDKGYSYGLPNK